MLPSKSSVSHTFPSSCKILTLREDLGNLDVLLLGPFGQSHSQFRTQEAATNDSNVGAVLGNGIELLKVIDTAESRHVGDVLGARQLLGLTARRQQDLFC